MRKIFYIISAFILSSCVYLDLNPLSEGSSETWYSSESEMNMSVMGLYDIDFWSMDQDAWTDDWTNRSNVNEFTGGTLNSATDAVSEYWNKCYKAISRANAIIEAKDKALNSGVLESKVKQFVAEAKFVKACQYARLVTHFGDVPLTTGTLTIDQAFAMGRTPKKDVITQIYNDFNDAIDILPVSYSDSETARATKGAALAMKARFALYISDWQVTADAAKACMDLDKYKLYDNFEEYFLPKTKNVDETILAFPRSIEYKVNLDGTVSGVMKYLLPRNVGGWGNYAPSWYLIASFECTDGKSIDKSPLYDPKDPFKNRDPRLKATTIEFGSTFIGVEYNPSPLAKTVMNYKTNTIIKNNDSRVNNQYASYNGFLWKKGIDDSWVENGFKVDPDLIVMRYADVLLMYAEAKMELNEIDSSVLDAINMVRARAYGVAYTETDKYPSITTTNQTELRRVIRNERRVEFAREGLRYMDIIRWRIADKVLNQNDYGMLDPNLLLADLSLYQFPAPEIDADGIESFDKYFDANKIKLLSTRVFDKDRQYLWPIPYKELLINENMKPNNPGY